MFLLLVLFLCSSGCDLVDSKNTFAIHIQTDKEEYNLDADDSVKVTITNKSNQTIYYSRCLSKTIEVVEENKIIKTAGLPVCHCICPAELKPDESIPMYISSISGESFQFHSDNREPTEPVAYRINYSLFFDEAFGNDPIPPKYSRSNTFSIAGTK